MGPVVIVAFQDHLGLLVIVVIVVYQGIVATVD
jgi:hypothetical protein